MSPFTFVAATTRAGMLSSPLRSRFGILLRLEFYTDEELKYIVERSAEILGVSIDSEGAAELAGRARELHASPTGCCAACVTLPRCAGRDASTKHCAGRAGNAGSG